MDAECPSLRHLDIRSCQRLDASLSNCFRDRLPLLEELLADRTSFCDLCLEGLFSGSAPPPIHTLHCAFCPITDEGLRILAASPSVPAKLSSLVLSNTKITASGVCSHLRALTSLSRLEICDVELTEDSLRVVGSLSRLEHLILEEGNVSDRGVAKLRGNFPSCVVVSILPSAVGRQQASSTLQGRIMTVDFALNGGSLFSPRAHEYAVHPRGLPSNVRLFHSILHPHESPSGPAPVHRTHPK